ncbi:ABC transporter permease [Paeniglutamicibacter sp. MACA_103]|uniref:ABC transporter permease n=1 Tax=Paeniglutamicibacter sp. MACA_103 TaxID=3377337 RepID=UPI00389457FA
MTTANPTQNAALGSLAVPAALRRFAGQLRHHPSLVIGLALVVGMTAVAALTPALSPYTVTQINDLPFASPSAEHWLGTDNLARDNFTRLAAATMTGLQISLASTLLAALVGSAAGILAGYFGGLFDGIVMRSVDVLLAIPAILLALVTRVIFGPGIWTLIISLAIISAPGFARVMRAPAISLRERDFVTSAEISGVGRLRIAASHLLPNSLTPLFVQFAATASMVVLMESILSFLGQGVLPPDPSAGRMIADSTRFMAREPMLILLPAAVIIAMTIAWNLIADGLQKLLSPRDGALNISTAPLLAVIRHRKIVDVPAPGTVSRRPRREETP